MKERERERERVTIERKEMTKKNVPMMAGTDLTDSGFDFDLIIRGYLNTHTH